MFSKREKRPQRSSIRDSKLQLEQLDCRLVPAAITTPWGDPTHLTISFAPDGTQIAKQTSNLFGSLNSHWTQAIWQKEILKGFQTWAAVSNINVALVPDNGQPFGLAGNSQKDPRFGDIRIGSQPMDSDVLAVTVPGDTALSGTWTGDVLFNSQNDYGKKEYGLFGIAVHEAGHAFGLSGSNDPKSVMFQKYQSNGALASSDIAQIQSLYGSRVPDKYEGSSGNNTPNKASTVSAPKSYKGETPLVAFGDISTNSDRDYYTFTGPSGYKGPVTLRLQTTGISLLNPMITVTDSKGKILGQGQSSTGLGGLVELKIPAITPGAKITVLVQGASKDIFGIGHYGLAVSFDQKNIVSPLVLNKVLTGDYQTLSPNDIDKLFQSPDLALFNDDRHTDETATAAVKLASLPGFSKNSVYEVLGSLSDGKDMDFYRIQTASVPKGKTSVLTVSVRALDPNGLAPRVTILNERSGALNTRVLANGNGIYTIQATNVSPSGNLFLKITVPPGIATPSGNYQLEARFGTVATQLTDFATGVVQANAAKNYNLYIGQTQLFQFLLSAGTSGISGAKVRVSIKDSFGNLVFEMIAPAGEVISAPAVLFAPGAYSVVFSQVGGGANGMVFRFSGKPITDPIGPAISDPTLKPIYQNPGKPGFFIYPGGITTLNPYWFLLLL